MSAGDSMQGRRLRDPREGAMQPGDYYYWPARKDWIAVTPNGHHASLTDHEVTEHEDGTITVSPSILVSTSDEQGAPVECWHGYLERGVWREA